MSNARTLASLIDDTNTRIKIPSGYGLDFADYGAEDSNSATTVSSNLMDDFEEGSYSPEYSTDGDPISGVTYDIQSGHYVKIGSFVYVNVKLRYDVTGSFSATTGNLTINLPFTCGSSVEGGGFRIFASTWQTNTPDSGLLLSSTDAIRLINVATTLDNSYLYSSGTNRNFLRLQVVYSTN